MANGIRWKIENDRKAVLQNINNVWPHGGAKPRRTTCVVLDCPQIARK
jgi:hypothetical protein